MTKSVLGIIGGSGIYDLPGLINVREEHIQSPWGEPSGALRIGDVGGLPVVFLSRHDQGHRLSPSDINYRANIDVLKRAGVTRSEEHTSELQSQYHISYAVFCVKKKKNIQEKNKLIFIILKQIKTKM